jgi:hypothetical protein
MEINDGKKIQKKPTFMKLIFHIAHYHITPCKTPFKCTNKNTMDSELPLGG